MEAEVQKTELLILEYKEIPKPVASNMSLGCITRIDAINNKSIKESAVGQSEEKLQKLKFSLTKLGSKEFGICRKCQISIPLEGILIKPESGFCVHCGR